MFVNLSPASACPPAPPTTAVADAFSLAKAASGQRLEVVEVVGNDALAVRLVASGLWPGAAIEWIAQAPFGDPLLFRLHGYRLALRRSEAERVLVRAIEAPR